MILYGFARIGIVLYDSLMLCVILHSYARFCTVVYGSV
jgi:hypothetical protein